MSSARKTPVGAFRKRLSQKGMVRVEVHVRKADAALVRSIAKALGDPQAAPETRTILRTHFARRSDVNLKDLLASAPLEGVDIERAPDWGRAFDL